MWYSFELALYTLLHYIRDLEHYALLFTDWCVNIYTYACFTHHFQTCFHPVSLKCFCVTWMLQIVSFSSGHLKLVAFLGLLGGGWHACEHTVRMELILFTMVSLSVSDTVSEDGVDSVYHDVIMCVWHCQWGWSWFCLPWCHYVCLTLSVRMDLILLTMVLLCVSDTVIEDGIDSVHHGVIMCVWHCQWGWNWFR